jgi:hypothetical protein
MGSIPPDTVPAGQRKILRQHKLYARIGIGAGPTPHIVKLGC